MKAYLLVLLSYVAIVAQGVTYSIDMIHSKIGFSIGYAGGVIDAEGRFKQFNGEIKYNQNDLTKLTAQIDIMVKSIDTGMEFRDKDLVSPNWFNADQFPNITFKSEKMKQSGDKYILSGKLTMHGISKDIEINVTPTTSEPKLGPGRLYIGFNCELTLNRKDYEIHTSDPNRSFWKYNDVMQSTGEMFVSDIVKIQLNILGVRSGQEIAQDFFADNSVEDAHKMYKQAMADNPNNLLFMERDYNGIGYQLMADKKLSDAIKVFQFNVELYPKSANVYDSLAEAYINNNQRSEAKAILEKGIAIAASIPQFQRAKKAMEDKLSTL